MKIRCKDLELDSVEAGPGCWPFAISTCHPDHIQYHVQPNPERDSPY